MIDSHLKLKDAIQGKEILLLNSLGKDAILCLEWLYNFAKVPKIISCYLKLEAGHPLDNLYLEYLKKRYPNVLFVEEINHIELGMKAEGRYQTPIFNNYVSAHQEFEEFSSEDYREQLRLKYGCDYICSGMSKYEGMGRAIFLKRHGLLHKNMIYPIGLFTKNQVVALLKGSGVKIHPSYREASGSHDDPTYYKMRNSFLVHEKHQQTMFEHYPMLELDKYRYEVLFGKG